MSHDNESPTSTIIVTGQPGFLGREFEIETEAAFVCRRRRAEEGVDFCCSRRMDAVVFEGHANGKRYEGGK